MSILHNDIEDLSKEDLKNLVHSLKKEIFQLREIIDNVPGDVYWKDTSGVWLGINARGSESLKKMGFPSAPKDVIGKTDSELFGEETARHFKENDRIIMKEKREISQEESAILDSGEKIVQLSIKRPLYNELGDVIGIVGNTVDITYLKKIENDLTAAKEKAEAANRAKTEFLANMSHDVKSPMTGIVMSSSLMMKNPAWLNVETAERIHASAEQVLNFFDSCLELSKLEKSELQSEKESFSLPVLLNEVHALFSPRAYAKKLFFKFDHESDVPALFTGYRGTLYRVILNLIGNAVKFTEEGGVTIRVFISEKTDDTHLTIGIAVSDTGPGIPEDKHQVIFEKLHRLTPSYHGKVEGSGIGLYIVDQYTQHMSGDIKVASEVGKGSTFTLFVPLALSDESSLSDQERQKHRALLQKTSVAPTRITEMPRKTTSPAVPPKITLDEHSPLVLVVEDNLTIQMVTEAILNSEGFRVDIASDGKEALEMFKPDTYLCVYMDMGLPDKQGHEVAQLIREKEISLNANTKTPIVALTAHAAVEVKAFCEDAGMQGVFSKPINKEKIDVVWARYGEGKDVTIPELTLLDDMVATCTLYKKGDVLPNEEARDDLPIIDIEGTMAFLHSEAKTNQLFNVLCTQLKEQYLPRFHTLVPQRDYAELRKEIHSLIGSLCYSKAPRLNEATLSFQTSARDASDATIEQAYARVKEEAEGFMAYWDKHQLSAGD